MKETRRIPFQPDHASLRFHQPWLLALHLCKTLVTCVQKAYLLKACKVKHLSHFFDIAHKTTQQWVRFLQTQLLHWTEMREKCDTEH